MSSLRIPLDGARVAVIPTVGEARAVFEYESGKRTDRAVQLNGQPVYAFDAAIALDGKAVGSARVESTTANLPPLDFGAVLYGQGSAELVVSPQDQFNIRVKLIVERVVGHHQVKSPGHAASPVPPSRAAV